MTADERHERRPGGGVAPARFEPLDQTFDADSLYALRAAVAAHAAAAGLDRHQVYDVTAVAHELAANAVVHGAGRGRLLLRADSGFLYCEVTDDGLPASGDGACSGGAVAPADGAAVPGSAVPWRTEHGHGLWLVAQIADQVGIDHGPDGTTATARFRLGRG